MATPLTRIFLVVGMSLAPLNGVESAGGAGGDSPYTCVANELKKITVDKPGAKITLKCPDDMNYLWPSQTPNSIITNVGTTSKCDQSTTLESVCPGATGNCTAAKVLELEIPQLPRTAGTFFISCQDKAPAGKDAANPTKGCSFQVSVSAYSPQGPQVCAIPGSSIELTVVGDGGRTQFGCGKQMTLSPSDSKKAFGSGCVKEEDLKDLERTTGPDGYYVVTATKKPSARKYCYLCGSSSRATGQATTNCAVLISVSAASGLAARSTFALALSCVLAVLHFA